MGSTGGLLILSNFRFPDHLKVWEWLDATEYGEQYELVIAAAQYEGQFGAIHNIECSALEPISDEQKFLFTLKGSEGLAKLVQEMEGKILDFHKK